MDEIKQRVQAQFNQTADAYVTSAGHAKGADLQRLVQLAVLTGVERALDVATGAGHTAFAFAPHVAEVIAFDLSDEMLSRVDAGAGERGLTNVRTVQGDIDALPFADGSFDRVTCRIAPHHFPNLPGAVAQMARVLKPGGLCLIVDNVTPEDAELDRFINAVEWLRDRSHVRAYSLSEWQQAFSAAGLTFHVAEQFTSKVDFAAWVERARTPEQRVRQARERLVGASAAAVEYYGIEFEPLRFCLQKALMVGQKG